MKTITYDETTWQLVPKEINDKMKEEVMEILLHNGDIYENANGNIVIETITPRHLWQAMLAAAPTIALKEQV